MTRPRHLPQRTCVACRRAQPKGELLRIVRTPTGEVQVDVTGKAPGRGAYLCRTERCAREAATPRKLSRALGVPVGPEVLEGLRGVVAADATEEDGASVED